MFRHIILSENAKPVFESEFYNRFWVEPVKFQQKILVPFIADA